MPTHCLALDFDGVIADSILECLVTAHNAYQEHLGRSEKLMGLDTFSSEFVMTFRQSRNFIRRGEDYVYLLLAADTGVSIRSQRDFDNFSDAHDTLRGSFRQLFYGQREWLQQRHPDDWLELNPLYPGMIEFLTAMDPKTVEIVTTKDLTSVALILEHAGIQLATDHLFQATKELRKPTILKQISTLRGIKEAEISFIDDHAATVIEVAEQTQVKSFFADWGYHSAEQLKEIHEQNIPVLSLEALGSKFKIAAPGPNEKGKGTP